MKRQLESDEADKRISTAALRLARSFTANIEGGSSTRLYINVNNPSVQRLLQARHQSHPQVNDAAGLLRSIKVILAGAEAPSGAGDLGAALARVGKVLDLLLA